MHWSLIFQIIAAVLFALAGIPMQNPPKPSLLAWGLVFLTVSFIATKYVT